MLAVSSSYESENGIGWAQDNVALIAVLEASEAPGKSQNRERRQLVCVANTHVHSNPELTDVKLWQVRSHFTSEATGPRRPVLLCCYKTPRVRA